MDIRAALREASIVVEQHGVKHLFIGSEDVRFIAYDADLTVRRVEIIALQEKICPFRYARHVKLIDFEGQIRLLQSRVALVGLGGLGGFILEMLLRLGVGRITVVDGDRFDETNLNRQLLATYSSIGRPKTDAALERVVLVNPTVEFTAFNERLTESNAQVILGYCDLAFDALDRISDRFILQHACRALGIPMLHAAVEGWTGQAASIFPNGPGIEQLYGEESEAVKTDTDLVDTAVTSPIIMAAFQVSEAVRILTGGHPGRPRLFLCDLEAMVLKLAGLR